jgi:hypothetical protein
MGHTIDAVKEFARDFVSASATKVSISPTFYERICANILAPKKVQT